MTGMQNEKKEAFLFLVTLISDYPKYRIVGLLLERGRLSLKEFEEESGISCHVLQKILNRWVKEGIVIRHSREKGGTAVYSLNAPLLRETLSYDGHGL